MLSLSKSILAMSMFLLVISCGKRVPDKSADDAKKIAALEEQIKQLKRESIVSSPGDNRQASAINSQQGLSGEVTSESKAQDNNGAILSIHRALLSDSAVKASVYYDWQLENARKANKEVIYFEVSVKNLSPEAQYVAQTHFSLEDTDGVTYREVQTLDYINATVQPVKSTRGGISFEIPKNCIPNKLLYNDITSRGEKIYCCASLLDIAKELGLVNNQSPQSFSPQQTQDAKDEGDENNPLGFTVDDIKKYCRNVEGPRDMPGHAGWSIYNAEKNKIATSFWVKNEAVYSVYIPNSQSGKSKYISHSDLDGLLMPYSNSQQWEYKGNATLKSMVEWEREDKQAWCEAITNEQNGLMGITIKTKAFRRLMAEMMKPSQ